MTEETSPLDEYAHRQLQPIRDTGHKQTVLKLVDKLLEFEAKTHPQNGMVEGRADDATMALLYANELLEWLVGWAIDLKTGLIANDVTHFALQSGEHNADDPIQEKDGGKIWTREPFSDPMPNIQDPQFARRVLVDMLSFSPIIHPNLAGHLKQALRALDFGETRPLFQALGNRKINALALWDIRFWAIEHISFMVGMGRKKKDTVKAVADAFCKSTDAIKKWEREILPEKFGNELVEHRKREANFMGKATLRRQNTLPIDELYISFALELFGEPTLKRKAAEHDELARAANAAPAKIISLPAGE